MIIAIDYDGTWTADPNAFQAIAMLMRHRGHRVLLVTARVGGHAEVEHNCGPFVDRVLFCASGSGKREHCAAEGEHVDVWIDDMPEMIVRTMPVSLRGWEPAP